MTLDPLSRLKGIETLFRLSEEAPDGSSLCIRVPVWRELKHCHLGCFAIRCFPLEPRSRLKGIETPRRWRWPNRWWELWIRVPVWRELKLSLLTVIVAIFNLLWIRVPVWRELKPFRQVGSDGIRNTLYPRSRLKGIETVRPSARTRCPHCDTLYPRSRLKGIETQARLAGQVLSAQRFVSAFPFEGNWNPRQYQHDSSDSKQ